MGGEDNATVQISDLEFREQMLFRVCYSEEQFNEVQHCISHCIQCITVQYNVQCIIVHYSMQCITDSALKYAVY